MMALQKVFPLLAVCCRHHPSSPSSALWLRICLLVFANDNRRSSAEAGTAEAKLHNVVMPSCPLLLPFSLFFAINTSCMQLFNFISQELYFTQKKIKIIRGLNLNLLSRISPAFIDDSQFAQ